MLERTEKIFNLFKLNGTSHSYLKDQSISTLRVEWRYFSFYSTFNRTFCMQTVETLIRRRFLRRLIWVYTVFICPTEKTLGVFGLTSWIFCMWCYLVIFFTFPYGVLSQVWYSIISIPDLCLLPYIKKVKKKRMAKIQKEEYSMHLLTCNISKLEFIVWTHSSNISQYIRLSSIYRLAQNSSPTLHVKRKLLLQLLKLHHSV